jgi:hypothetical protein
MFYAMPPVKKLDFMFFDAGGGHRAAAFALKSVIEQQGRPWEVRAVNLQELLEPLDVFRKYTGVRMEDVYNRMLKKGLTLGSAQLIPAMHALIRSLHGKQVRILAEFWRASPPDLVVSLIPNFNRALWHGLRQAATPLVTILTDLADFPPHFWMERQEQYFICGTARAVEQARALGHSDERVFRTSGMILRPKFYESIELPREAEREKLGLKAHAPTGLMMFGGEGSSQMVRIVESLSKARVDLQLIAICGHNQRLRERLKKMQPGFPMFVEGFTSEVPYYMRLTDFFIGKPGPGSISEALAMRLPVIVERNAWTLAQERYNTEWIREHQLGVVLKSFRDIAGGVRELLEPSNFERYRANAAALNNQAVFEIPEILDELLRRENRRDQ